LNAFWIARFDLNVATLIALTIALASVVPFSVLSRASSVSAGRWAPALFTSSTLPSIAVALAGGALAPSLREPANAFAVAVGASTIAALLLPSVALRRPPVSLQHGLRSLIRDPITIILFSATAIATSLTLFGSALDPRSRALGGNAGRWVAQVSLAEGATLVQTVGVVEELESRLSELEPVKRHWSWIDAGRARILIELQESARGRREREAARSRILRSLRGAGASVRLTATFGGSAQPDSWSDDIDDRASIDEEVRTYRMIVRGSEIESVRAAAARIRDRLSSIGFRGFAVHEETAPPSIRVDLVPFGSTRSEERAAVARALAAQSSLPSAIRLPGEPQRSVRVYTDRSPRDLDFVPQRQDLLNRPIAFAGGWIVPAMRYRTKDSLILPAFARQSGRFVVPISVAIHDRRIEERRTKRDKIDRNLAAMPLPAGVELDRPSASPWNVPIEKLRLFGIAAMLPLLLFAFAVIVLGSFAGAFDALVPLAGGVAVAAPLLWMNQTRVDELTLFALGAVAASTLPFAIMLLRRCEQRHVTKDAYRTFRNSAIPLVLAGIIVAGLLVGSTIGANAAEDAWASSLRSAGAAALASLSSMPFLSAALLLGRAAWHRRSHAETRERRNPPAWSDRRAGITLAARSLTKRYPNGLFALREISFELSPGIIGLLGPNGAGKTTLLRLMTGLLLPTRGQVLFRGAPVLPENLAEYRRHIGFLPQEFNAYPGFTAEEFLDYWALERGITDPKERAGEIELLLTAVGLEGEEKRKVRDFSGGMRQRIGIARALLGAPPVLIVDEPTTGLDIEARNRFRGLILSIAVHRIVILSTHIAGDVEATASRILLLHKGRLRFDGAPATLIERARGRVFETVLGDDDVRHFSERYRITARVRTLGGIRVRAVAAPDEAIEGAAVEPSLEEAYLAEIDRADVTRRGWRTRSRFSFLTEKDG
ncbi:MAG TPA: ATP-binding cassette domain-containing protein, partial [Thermoanaerobaculia bacterium]